MQKLKETLDEIALRYRPEIFRWLRRASPDADWADRFDRNFRLRTLLTIPEVFTTGVAVANHLDFSGIAAVGAIAADESGVTDGVPNPTSVHSLLLIRAFDSLRAHVFGLDPLDASRPLCLTRVLHRLTAVNIDATEVDERWRLIRADLELQGENGFAPPLQFSARAAAELEQALSAALRGDGITPATLIYCHAQFTMQRCDNPARVIGRALMHEHLADGMLSQLESALFIPRRAEWPAGSYETEVAPYFLAHRDAAGGSYVELEHAARMQAIAAPFADHPFFRQCLLEEAERFAHQQQQLFDSLLPPEIQPARGRYSTQILARSKG